MSMTSKMKAVSISLLLLTAMVNAPICVAKESSVSSSNGSPACALDDVGMTPWGPISPGRTGRPRVALALGGGGLRGAAHVGVLRVLQREGIPIDCITGCSIGSVVGGLYCAGMPLDVIEAKLLSGQIQKGYAPIWVRSPILQPVSLAVATIRRQPGLSNASRFAKYLDKQLAPYNRRVEDLNPRFCALANNLIDGQPYQMLTGNLASAIAVSSALPPVIKPVHTPLGDFIDGGLRANVPTTAARNFDPAIVIGVSVTQNIQPTTHKKVRTIKGVADRMTVMGASVIDTYHGQLADITIGPDCNGISIFSTKKSDVVKAIQAGECAAAAALPAIRRQLEKHGMTPANAYNPPTDVQPIGSAPVPVPM